MYQHLHQYATEDGGCAGAEARKLAEHEALRAGLVTVGRMPVCPKADCKYFVDTGKKDWSPLQSQHAHSHKADIVMFYCRFPEYDAQFANARHREAHESKTYGELSR